MPPETPEEAFRTATQVDQDFALAWNSLGYYLLMNSKNKDKDNYESAIKEAIQYFDKAVKCKKVDDLKHFAIRSITKAMSH